MTHVAFPFLTLPDAMVIATPWSTVDEHGAAVEVGNHLAGWDYAVDLAVQRTVSLNRAFSHDVLGVDPEDLDLALIVRIGTGSGSMPRRLETLFSRSIGTDRSVLINHAIGGRRLSQRLLLETTIVLGAEARPIKRFAPTAAGSILWRDRIDVALEGQAPRFPMETVSFSERFKGRAEQTSPWLLHWLPGQLHRDFGGAVRLYLNNDHTTFMERFTAADPLTLQVALADVITQILSYAIVQDDLEEQLADCEATSVAGHIATWLRLAFPDHDLVNVRTLHDYERGRFNAAILAMADPNLLGGDE
jgi:hypothetical protein